MVGFSARRASLVEILPVCSGSCHIRFARAVMRFAGRALLSIYVFEFK
jgi:hypothetical protein